MTEVSFYHLQRAPLERVLPKLLEKVVERGLRALVIAGSEERVETLNRLLWTYEQRSFLPHGSVAEPHAEAQPILLAARDDNRNGAKVLVLVDGAEGDLAAYERCLDVFDGNDATALTAARARFTACKRAGHGVSYWQQDGEGRWERGD